MLKIKNKFIFFIIIIIVGIILYGLLNSYLEKNINRNSYIILINGEATINNNFLDIDKKEKIITGDTVKTIGKEALAVLEWGDGSVTRLGGNTSIKIENLEISKDLGFINIGFEIFSGKSWSNVISFLGEGSYFKEYFRDSEAAARGTIFNVDLDNNYLYVLDHKISLTTYDGNNILIEENNPLNLSTFSFILLEDFIVNVKDKAWEALNYKIDEEFFNGLKKQIKDDIDNVVDLTSIDIEKIVLDVKSKDELYNKLLLIYQKYNFVKPNEKDLFKTKIELKETLIKLASNENRGALVKSTLYDFKDTINFNEFDSFNKILNILYINKSYLGNINIGDFINNSGLPDGLKEQFINNYNILKNIFGESVDFIKDPNFNINSIENKANDLIHDGLDILFNK